MELNKFYLIEDFIELVCQEKDRGIYYSVYAPQGTQKLSSGMSLFIGEQSSFDDDDNEIVPEVVVSQGLEMCYSDERFQDVVRLAFKQKPDASTGEIVKCLNYYAEEDDFLDLV